MKIGFELRKIVVPLSDILPVRRVNDPQSNIKRYRTIRASIKEVGLIEPLVVYPQKGAPGKYLLLDGHLRHYALKDLGRTEADVKASMTLLDGINEEAADLLKDKAVSPKAIRLMRKVSGVRQIEIAELMVSAGNYTKGYAEALVLGTPKD